MQPTFNLDLLTADLHNLKLISEEIFLPIKKSIHFHVKQFCQSFNRINQTERLAIAINNRYLSVCTYKYILCFPWPTYASYNWTVT